MSSGELLLYVYPVVIIATGVGIIFVSIRGSAEMYVASTILFRKTRTYDRHIVGIRYSIFFEISIFPAAPRVRIGGNVVKVRRLFSVFCV
jgi:hypothetical protein